MVQPSKEQRLRLSTEDGMQIDLSEQLAKQDSSTCVSRESDSNTTVSIFSDMKHDFSNTSTERHMQIRAKEPEIFLWTRTVSERPPSTHRPRAKNSSPTFDARAGGASGSIRPNRPSFKKSS
jgi:hypothetical protein